MCDDLITEIRTSPRYILVGDTWVDERELRDGGGDE